MCDRDEDALILASLGGETEAYGVLVRKYQQRMYWVAYRMLGEHEEARDVTQEALVRAWRKLDTFDRVRRFYTWIYRILVNLALDRLRARARRAGPLFTDTLPSREPPPDGHLLGEELRTEVWAVLDELPPRYRAVLILRDVEGLSGKEISNASGVGHGTVRWRIHRARRLFREAWERRHAVREEEE